MTAPAFLPISQCPLCLDVEELDLCPSCGRTSCLGCFEVRACCSSAIPVVVHDQEKYRDQERVA